MAKDIKATRTHKIHSARASQLNNNILAWKGGKTYIDARLHRSLNESDLSWDGDLPGGIPGRKGRAYLINDSGRVVDKINQYLFSSDARRDGVDVEWGKDVTTTGMSLRQFWETASEQFTAGQWLWLQADRGAPDVDPATSRPKVRSKAQKSAAGDRIYWNIWSSTEVVDWCFDEQGNLLWLMTADSVYDNKNPNEEAKSYEIRTLWHTDPDGCKWTRFRTDKPDLVIVAEGAISIPDVPFILLGLPSEDPWWYDDVEMIQCAMLNLESLNHENLVKTVYPQLVITETMLDNLEVKLVEKHGTASGEKITEIARELIKGLDRPFVESGEDGGITRYLQPSAQDLKAIPEQQSRLRQLLFDMVGLALFNKESRQVQSAASKQFDHLDIEATLKNRSLLFQESEAKLVALSSKLDSDFKSYDSVWPQEFSVPNTPENVDSLVQLANFTELPPTMVKRIQRVAMKLLNEIDHIPEEEQQTIIDEIAHMASQAPAEPLEE